MIVNVSTDAGGDGEIAIVTRLEGMCVTVTDPALGEPFAVELIGADWTTDDDAGGSVPEVYGHLYVAGSDDGYQMGEAVTFVLGEEAVLTYL